jgi:lipoyl(octanoyl) transferase
MRNQVHFMDWGLVPYQQAWDQQESIFKVAADLKFERRLSGAVDEKPIEHHLIFCEHPPVYTLGKSGKIENLLLNQEELEVVHAQFFPINRGGDITYHGPGQLVGYPIFDLEQFYTDIHLYLRNLEEAIILTLAEYGIKAGRYEGYTGVWIDADLPSARKICAMGVRCSRWITMHGFAFNVNTDLSFFKHIVPCGIDDKDVTSIQRELGHEVDMNELKKRLKAKLSSVFNIELVS